MAAWVSQQVGSSTQFLGAHAETLQALTKLQLLAQVTPSLSLSQRIAIAADTVQALWPLVQRHHQDEEQLLFPAMQKRAKRGEQTEIVMHHIDRLIKEHREIEAVWQKIQPELSKLASGIDIELDAYDCDAMVQFYRSHMQFEEMVVLPLAAQILTGDDEDSISLSLALRHNIRKLSAHI